MRSKSKFGFTSFCLKVPQFNYYVVQTFKVNIVKKECKFIFTRS